ncbi:MAG: DUF6036 family nucleotidyltransferase [Coriobacteriia bacterium]|nr:DUF6036 family nucleotidyltransferase [Coriobacteriia bacterium]
MDLTRDDVLALLDELISILKERGITGRIAVYGGSAIAYYHETRGVTRDIDSIFSPYREIAAIAEELANKHEGLRDDWLDMAIMDVMPFQPDDNPEIYYQDEGITVQFGSKEYLLAMKAVSSRRSEQDRLDAALLYNSLSLKSYLDINDLVSKYYVKGNWGSQELFWEDIEELALSIR